MHKISFSIWWKLSSSNENLGVSCHNPCSTVLAVRSGAGYQYNNTGGPAPRGEHGCGARCCQPLGYKKRFPFGICLLVFKSKVLWSLCATRLDVQENNLHPKEDLSHQSPGSSTRGHPVTPKAVPTTGGGAGGDPRVGASDCHTESHLRTRFPTPNSCCVSPN